MKTSEEDDEEENEKASKAIRRTSHAKMLRVGRAFGFGAIHALRVGTTRGPADGRTTAMNDEARMTNGLQKHRQFELIQVNPTKSNQIMKTSEEEHDDEEEEEKALGRTSPEIVTLPACTKNWEMCLIYL